MGPVRRACVAWRAARSVAGTPGLFLRRCPDGCRAVPQGGMFVRPRRVRAGSVGLGGTAARGRPTLDGGWRRSSHTEDGVASVHQYQALEMRASACLHLISSTFKHQEGLLVALCPKCTMRRLVRSAPCTVRGPTGRPALLVPPVPSTAAAGRGGTRRGSQQERRRCRGPRRAEVHGRRRHAEPTVRSHLRSSRRCRPAVRCAPGPWEGCASSSSSIWASTARRCAGNPEKAGRSPRC